MYKSIRLVYDKVSLGFGCDRVIHHISGAITGGGKPPATATDCHTGVNLLILHSLLGSRGSWRPFLRNLHTSFQQKGVTANAFLVDLRYHGSTFDQQCLDQGSTVWDPLCEVLDGRNDIESLPPHGFLSGNDVLPDDIHALVPQSTGNYLLDIALDINAFITSTSEFADAPPVVIGHSLGGKAALLHALMANGAASSSALTPPRAIISLDAAPSEYTHTHSGLLKAMHNLPLRELSSRQHANQVLAQEVADANTRAFALTQLVQDGFDLATSTEISRTATSTAGAPLRWQVGLVPLRAQEQHVHSWPEQLASNMRRELIDAAPGHTTTPSTRWLPDTEPLVFDGPVHFIGAEMSSRLTTPEYVARLDEYFPQHELTILRGGHFVHQGPDAIRCADICADVCASVMNKCFI